jgi:hypothetical protein
VGLSSKTNHPTHSTSQSFYLQPTLFPSQSRAPGSSIPSSTFAFFVQTALDVSYLIPFAITSSPSCVRLFTLLPCAHKYDSAINKHALHQSHHCGVASFSSTIAKLSYTVQPRRPISSTSSTSTPSKQSYISSTTLLKQPRTCHTHLHYQHISILMAEIAVELLFSIWALSPATPFCRPFTLLSRY